MKTFKVAIALGVLGLPLALLSVPAQAATAHNSQAGANGNTTNVSAPTGRHLKMKKHMKRM